MPSLSELLAFVRDIFPPLWSYFLDRRRENKATLIAAINKLDEDWKDEDLARIIDDHRK